MGNQPIFRILIADDHALMRDGLKLVLTQDAALSVVDEATSGMEAIRKFREHKPDLVILDISMPDFNGMEATRQIMELDPHARIVILSMYEDEDYIKRCIESGVRGYVVKSETSRELLSAVQAVLNGQKYFSTKVQNTIFKEYTSRVTGRKTGNEEAKLTRREVEIGRLVADGLSSQQIADKLFISPRTVEAHRANLMKKVGVKNAIELVKKIEKMGLLAQQ